jgi:hypothetical protein
MDLRMALSETAPGSTISRSGGVSRRHWDGPEANASRVEPGCPIESGMTIHCHEFFLVILVEVGIQGC